MRSDIHWLFCIVGHPRTARAEGARKERMVPNESKEKRRLQRMTITIQKHTYTLDNFLTAGRTIIFVGLKTEGVYNTITLNKEADTFQCQLRYDGQNWLLSHGQYRADCEKALAIESDIPCHSCMSLCVSINVANPDYSWRKPERQTMLNGMPVTEDTILKRGDRIAFQ